MNLTQLNSPKRGKRPDRIRRGRGPASGKGGTAGRGHKGQKSRSGYSRRMGFEGMQMPLIRKLPKRGFNNKRFRVELAALNVADLEKAFDEGQSIGPDEFLAKGLINRIGNGAKVLAKGTITKKFSVKAHAFSESAKKKIEAAGGSVQIIER